MVYIHLYLISKEQTYSIFKSGNAKILTLLYKGISTEVFIM